MTEQAPQPIPPFGQPENPLLKLPTETPAARTRPVIRVRPRPEAIGEIMPETAVEARRRELDLVRTREAARQRDEARVRAEHPDLADVEVIESLAGWHSCDAAFCGRATENEYLYCPWHREIAEAE